MSAALVAIDNMPPTWLLMAQDITEKGKLLVAFAAAVMHYDNHNQWAACLPSKLHSLCTCRPC